MKARMIMVEAEGEAAGGAARAVANFIQRGVATQRAIDQIVPRRRRRPRFTEAEWSAIQTALLFVNAGEDPWEDQIRDDDKIGVSPTLHAVRSALAKF